MNRKSANAAAAKKKAQKRKIPKRGDVNYFL